MRINEIVLTEMPHIMAAGRAFDLELENLTSQITPGQASDQDQEIYINYVRDWITNKPIQSRRGITMQVKPHELESFINRMLANEFLEKTTVRFYGRQVWTRIRDMLRARLQEID